MTNRTVVLHINGEEFPVHIRNADTLLFTLRDKIGLTGAKPGCLNGDCGACTVIADGEAVKSCLMLAAEAAKKEIITIEGLENSPVQQEFMNHFAFQCGYCTPGFIMNCHALIETEKQPADQTIQKWLESNICRCTGYQEIEKAVKAAIACHENTNPMNTNPDKH